jgi:transposase
MAVHERVEEQQTVLDTRVRKEAKADETTRRLMTVPGVGVVTAMAFHHASGHDLNQSEADSGIPFRFSQTASC